MIQSKLPAGWQVRFFSPWAASDLNALLAEFFTVVTSALPPNGAKKARNALLACARVAVPALGAVPYAGGVAKAAGDRAIEHLAKQPPWTERFRGACEELGKLRLRVLVVVDDVDRLHADELAVLMKAIRLLGRFPGVHYLLSYDEQTILTVLRASSVAGGEPDRALSFMEKIVQVPLVVPPAQRRHLDKLVNETVEKITERASERLTDAELERFGFAYQEGMTHGLTTVRSIYRFGAQASAYLPLIGADDVNLADFMILTYIRLHYPAAYERLPSWRWELTGDGFPMSRDLVNPGAVDCAKLLAEVGVPDRDVVPLQTCLEVVFPRLGGDGHSVATSIGGRGGARRAASPDYFDRYFNFGIPEGDISDVVASNALAEAVAGGGPNWQKVIDWLGRGDLEAADQARLVAKFAHLSSGQGAAAALERAHVAARLIPRMTDGQAFTGNPRRECVQWLGRELHSVQTADRDSTEIVQQLREEAGGLWYVLHAIEAALSDHNGPASPFLEALTSEAATAARIAVLENLAAKDDATDNGPITMLIFVMKHGDADGLREAIAQGLGDGRFSVEDVAARCVTVGYSKSIGEDGEIIGFQHDLLRQLVSDDLLLAYTPGPAPTFNERDVSWCGKRAAAHDVLMKLRQQLEEAQNTIGDETGS
jgi:hypothetical protein